MICTRLFLVNLPLLTYVFPFFLQALTFAFWLIGWNITKIWVCNQLYSDRSWYLCIACFLLSSLYVPCFSISLTIDMPSSTQAWFTCTIHLCTEELSRQVYTQPIINLFSSAFPCLCGDTLTFQNHTGKNSLRLQGLSTSFLLSDMWLISTKHQKAAARKLNSLAFVKYIKNLKWNTLSAEKKWYKPIKKKTTKWIILFH